MARHHVVEATYAKHQSSWCILDMLQWLQCRHWQFRHQHTVATVQSECYQCHHQLLCDCLASNEPDADHECGRSMQQHICLIHCQFQVQINKITYFIHLK